MVKPEPWQKFLLADAPAPLSPGWTAEGGATASASARNARLCAALLLAHGLLWAWVGTALRSNLDLPGDMLEAYVWGQAWQWGYFKHPPLMAWAAGAWFSLMPTSDASYALLASLNATIGMVGFVLLSREVLPPRWRLPALAAAMLLPAVTTMALRFNANAVLVATWPWVAAFFVRYMARGRWLDAAGLAGAAALALLGKYFSGVLLLALLLAALSHAPWRARLWTGRTLGCLALFALLLWPHLAWLAANDFAPLAYAQQATEGVEGSPSARALRFAFGQAALLLPAVLLLWWCTRGPDATKAWRGALADLLRPGSSPLWWLCVGPILLTVLATVLTGARTVSVWGLPMTLVVKLFVVERLVARGAMLDTQRWRMPLALAWAVAAALAPMAWAALAISERPQAAEPRAELARAVDRGWIERFGTPLPWVAGTEAYAAAVSFYGPSHAGYWSLREPGRRTPWVDAHRVQGEGGALVCRPADSQCVDAAGALGGQVQRLSVAKSTRGFVFAPHEFIVVWVPPYGAGAIGHDE